MYTLGFDVGSASVKAALLNVETGETVATGRAPKTEMPITARNAGWAEQDPGMWWENLKLVSREVLAQARVPREAVTAIGISYQMHGLVLVDDKKNLLRPAIIWCDSRAVEIGRHAFVSMGKERCLSSLLNSPGNFTASKLRWVKMTEQELFVRTESFLLPGDYIALKMTGESTTTVPGLSEAILWDFERNCVASFVLEGYGIPASMVPKVVPTFGEQGRLTQIAAEELGLIAGTPVTYRAGDQPNNALSVNVLEPGEIAAKAGTSGVVYGISDQLKSDPESRVNSFAHVNHGPEQHRIGVLLCISGAGIANSWFRRMLGKNATDYTVLDEMAQEIPAGSDGVTVFPFGNGAERMLGEQDLGAHILDLNFNVHTEAHLLRAAQEGVAFAFKYGMDIMSGMGMKPKVIRAGLTNMFLGEVFTETLAQVTGVTIELYNTDGATGAARGAAIGNRSYASMHDAFKGVMRKRIIEPKRLRTAEYMELYENWLIQLQSRLKG